MRGRNTGGVEEGSGTMRGSGGVRMRRIQDKNKQTHLGVELAAEPRIVCQCVEDSVCL